MSCCVQSLPQATFLSVQLLQAIRAYACHTYVVSHNEGPALCAHWQQTRTSRKIYVGRVLSLIHTHAHAVPVSREHSDTCLAYSLAKLASKTNDRILSLCHRMMHLRALYFCRRRSIAVRQAPNTPSYACLPEKETLPVHVSNLVHLPRQVWLV